MCHPEIFHTNHQCHVKDSKSNAEFRNNLSAIHAKCSLTFESLPTTHLGLDQRMWQQTQNTCWLKILPLSMYTSSKHCWLFLKSFSSSVSNFFISFQARNEYGWSQPSEMFSFTTSQKNIQSEFASTTTSTLTNATKIIICFLRASYCLKLLKPTPGRKC